MMNRSRNRGCCNHAAAAQDNAPCETVRDCCGGTMNIYRAPATAWYPCAPGSVAADILCAQQNEKDDCYDREASCGDCKEDWGKSLRRAVERCENAAREACEAAREANQSACEAVQSASEAAQSACESQEASCESRACAERAERAACESCECAEAAQRGSDCGCRRNNANGCRN